MSYEYVIDSYAWIEYFRGTESGRKTRKYIESDSATTSALTLAELKEKYLRERWSFFDEDMAFMTARTSVTTGSMRRRQSPPFAQHQAMASGMASNCSVTARRCS